MADKAISELNAATTVTSSDLFVTEQGGTAKKVTGQTLINDLAKALDGHGGIQSFSKVSTSGLADTYRMTLADGTTADIIVTNGRSISSLKKTATSGLKDTYTIAYNDGTSTSFTVTNGRSISSITETKIDGLTRTYTILFNDGTSESFVVTDGRSVTEIKKTGSSGLVDTYTITYNDGTSGAFTVTNGEKGDKGDNVYLWIKYASQEPTEESHSFGDLPDNWIGIYSGTLAVAPTDWTQYKWYEMKGQKGDTGDAATLVSWVVEYQVSDSGTIIPSGAWGTSIPVVPQGKYMWTRTTLTYNTGNPIISYSITRIGIDGAGSVSSVNDISPDADGNVHLTPENVGALSSAGGDMTGPINMQGQSLKGLNSPSEDSEAATKGYVDNMAPAFAQASVLTNLTSGEKLTISLGKIMKAIADLISHLANKSNPHSVTADQAGAAPTSHASAETTYGKATSSNYGHVKLSASTSSTSGASAGVAATPSAVKSAYDLANGKQNAIVVSSATNASKSLSKGTVAAITSISVEAGTYLVCANATFPTYESLEPAKYTHMLCVNTSTSFDHGKATAIGNVDGMQVDLNVSTVITLASAGTIYMLGYAAAASTVTNGNLYAIKIG